MLAEVSSTRSMGIQQRNGMRMWSRSRASKEQWLLSCSKLHIWTLLIFIGIYPKMLWLHFQVAHVITGGKRSWVILCSLVWNCKSECYNTTWFSAFLRINLRATRRLHLLLPMKNIMVRGRQSWPQPLAREEAGAWNSLICQKGLCFNCQLPWDWRRKERKFVSGKKKDVE